jgi:hypothetical protein
VKSEELAFDTRAGSVGMGKKDERTRRPPPLAIQLPLLPSTTKLTIDNYKNLYFTFF